MKLLFLSLLTLIAILVYSCKTQKESTDKTEESMENVAIVNSFIIGSGGGFTGRYNDFKVHSTGKVDKLNENTSNYEPYTEISEVNIDTYFTQLNNLHLESIDFDHPGNMTFYIKVNTENGLHTVKWGDAKFEIKKEVELFFESIMTEIYKKER